MYIFIQIYSNLFMNRLIEEKKILKLLKEYNSRYELLNEAKSKLDVLINKVGFSEPIAKVFDELCGSLVMWMANKLFKHYVQRTKNYNVEGNMTPQGIKEFALREINNLSTSLLRNTIVPMMDYIRVGLNGNISSLEENTWKEIHEKQFEWHKSLNIGDGSINYNETHPIILDFRKDDGEGYYWVDLETKNSDEECKRMGHCGRSSYGYLYSLRSDKNLPGGKYRINRSHLTAAIGTDGILYQLKGPKNSKPKEEYHKYIEPLFNVLGGGEEEDYLIQGFGTEYASQEDFKLTDLPDQTIRELYNNRPELFSSRSLQRKLGEMGVIEVKPLQTTFTLEIHPKDIGYYLGGDTFTVYKHRNSEGKSITKRVGFYEKIMSDDVWDMYDSDGGRWEDNLYYVDSDNESKIKKMIKTWTEKEGIEIDESLSLEQMITKYDDTDEISDALRAAMSDVERDEYAEYLRSTLEEALGKLGNVIEFYTDNIKIQIDLKDHFSDTELDEHYESYEECNNDPKCLFNYLFETDYIDKPIPRFYDYWDADIDKELYNDRLTDRLNEI